MDNTINTNPHDDPIPPPPVLPPLPPLPGVSQAQLPPMMNQVPVPMPPNGLGLGPPSFPRFSGPGSFTAAGPWSFHEHRLFEQGCIMHGWGNWKKIQEAIPGRTKDQCKSHGQKFLKQNPHEKDRLNMEHRKMMQLKHQQMHQQQGNNPSLPQTKTVTATKRVQPKQKAGKVSKMRVSQPDQPNMAPPATFKNESLPVQGGSGKKENARKPGMKFAIDSIDTICKDIYQRKMSSGCNDFPTGAEETPCTNNNRPEYQQSGVEELLSLSVAVSASVDDEGTAMADGGGQNRTEYKQSQVEEQLSLSVAVSASMDDDGTAMADGGEQDC